MRDNKKYSEDFRGRFKATSKKPGSSSGIASIWAEQRRMEEEDERIAKELAEAKKKTKELQRTLRKNRYGEISKNTNQKTKQTVTTVKTNSKKYYDKVSSILKQNKKIAYSAVGVFVLVVSIGVVINSFSSDDSTATLGESTAQIPVAEDLPRETPDFPILFPAGKSDSDFDVVRISPPDADASYTYLDRFTKEGQIFRVTQQEVPSGFDIVKTATDFQATNTIQVDDSTIYHGFAEGGGVQSLIFIKDDKLISISSPQKFSDDQWAAYYLSLN